MALPKLNDKPKYELVIPSTQKKVKFRPYLVKEEKVLMLAMESQDQIQIFEAIADTIEACVDGDIDKNALTTFDIEYMFVKIRTKSVGENIKLTPKCEECEEENEINIGLDEIIINIPEENHIIKISDDINIKMRWPSFLSVLSDDVVNDKSETEQTFKMISKCIESVMTEDENMMFKDEPKKEKFSYKRVQENTESTVSKSSNNIIINSTDQMLFDRSIIKVKAGESVTLTLNHTGKIAKEFMGHNFALIKEGVDIDDFALRAMTAKESDYIPEGDETYAYTKMLGGGESDRITFDSPKPGTYTFLCTFPGHYQVMRGEFIVE